MTVRGAKAGAPAGERPEELTERAGDAAAVRFASLGRRPRPDSALPGLPVAKLGSGRVTRVSRSALRADSPRSGLLRTGTLLAWLAIPLLPGCTSGSASSPPALTIRPLEAQLTYGGVATAPLEIGIEGGGDAGAALEVRASSTDPDLLPPESLRIERSGRKVTLVLDPPAGRVGDASVTVEAARGAQRASVLFPVTVGVLDARLEGFLNGWASWTEEQKRGEIDARAPWYLGNLPKDLAVVYSRTRSPRIYEVLDQLVDFYRDHYLYDGRLMGSGYATDAEWWWRDPFARDGISFYLVYRCTGNRKYLELIEAQAKLWMASAARAEHLGFTVYPAAVDRQGEPRYYTIDLNQNIEVGLLFSLLYWEKDSRYFRSPFFKDVARNEVGAAVAQQRANGALPLVEESVVEDTGYGGYAGQMLYHLAQMWGDPAWLAAVKGVGDWLFRNYPQSHPWNMPEDAPNFYRETYTASNLIMRFPTFYAAGVSQEDARSWFAFARDRFSQQYFGEENWFYLYQSVPWTYFQPKAYSVNLAPYVFVDPPDGNVVRVRIVAQTVDQVAVRVVPQGGTEAVFRWNEAQPRDTVLTVPVPLGAYQISVDVEGNRSRRATGGSAFELSSFSGADVRITVFDERNPFSEKVLQ